jgi:predicted RNA binding protein YcfA (HicA-like mRNA interferase family)
MRYVARTGSHVQMRYVADDGEVRNVTVPMHDRIKTNTLQNIADQCGANDFDDWCRWIDEHA